MYRDDSFNIDRLHHHPPIDFSPITPISQELHQEALLVQEIRPALTLKEPSLKERRMISLLSMPTSFMKRVANCMSAISFFPSDQSVTLNYRSISTICIPKLPQSHKVYIDTSNSDKTEEIVSDRTGTETPTRDAPSPAIDLPPPVGEKQELSAAEILKIQKKIDLCAEGQSELRSLRKELLKLQNKERKLQNLGYQKTIHAQPIFDCSMRKARELHELIKDIDRIEIFLSDKRVSAEVLKLKKEIKQIKQLLLLEETLNRNLTGLNTKLLHKEFKVKPIYPGATQWEELCAHFKIDSLDDLETQWSALKDRNQQEFEKLSSILKVKIKKASNKITPL